MAATPTPLITSETVVTSKGSSFLATCDDSCGWVAAVMAMISFGSFGVPVKYVKVEVDPLVMQSYKTLVCFATCWLVIFLGEEVRWSPWGLASGLFWVPGAACGIYGIRHAGLAVAVGTWSSIIVLTSFIFGIVVFQEKVRNFYQAALAFSCLMVGLIGMSRYSAGGGVGSVPRHHSSSNILDDMSSSSRDGLLSNLSISSRSAKARPSPLASPKAGPHSSVETEASTAQAAVKTGLLLPLEVEHLLVEDDEADIMRRKEVDAAAKDRSNKDRLVFCWGRISLTKRQMGILGAVVNGAWGGMNLIPLHFAKRDAGLSGAGYLISYATGSFIVNTVMWILLFVYHLYQKKGHLTDALESLPKWHWREIWLPGLLCGFLYSMGNFSAILAVTYLGQGTGYSFCQMSLFVSGLWGVFYFREIKGTATVVKWFLSAAVAVTGIIWLSYEHVSDSSSHR